jgi:hypothetical protein
MKLIYDNVTLKGILKKKVLREISEHMRYDREKK